MILKDLYKTMVPGQKLIIDELYNKEFYLIHAGTSDDIPLKILDMNVLIVRNDYTDYSSLYIVVEE